jgi:coenzyme F420 hydrogenase subunit beta
MMNRTKNGGQAGLRSAVFEQDLCTGCAACVNLCPNLCNYKDNTVVLHECDLSSGRCYTFCPRTPTHLEELRQSLFDPRDLGPELGALKGFYVTRAADGQVRAAAQHGGTVTALVSLALSEGLIDAAVLAGQQPDFLPQAVTVNDSEDVAGKAASKFVVSPTVAEFNQACKGGAEMIGVVATPCQCLALAKMRAYGKLVAESPVHKLGLVIGLFCGWALSWRRLRGLLAEYVREVEILGMDIPPSKHQCMEVYTSEETIEIPIERVQKCVRPSCNYCFDMTAEFADISIGSARSPEGWEVDKGWNQVIVRTTLGNELLSLAREKAVLEFKEVPDGSLAKLKAASLTKKRACLKNLTERSGSREDLYYLNWSDPVISRLSESYDAPPGTRAGALGEERANVSIEHGR